MSSHVLKFNFLIQLPKDSVYLCISDTLNSTYICVKSLFLIKTEAEQGKPQPN